MATAAVPAPACDPELNSSVESGTPEVSEQACCKSDKGGDSAGIARFRRGGTLPTAVCLSKAAIGAGVLSMSVHCAEVGLVYQLVALVIGAALTLWSIRLIAKASIGTGCWSYEDICDDLFHPSLSLLTGIINVCNCLGSGAGYLIVCGQVFTVLSGAGETGRRLFVVAVGVLVCAPLAVARHVGFMRHLAAGSIAALLLLVFTVVWCLAEDGVDETITPQTAWLGPGGATVFTYMNSINNVVFAYNNQFNVPQLTGELTPQPSLRRMSNVGYITTAMCFLLYGGVSVFGLLAFGVGDNQLDSLVLDLTPRRNSPLVLLTLLAVMFSVLTCFQFHIYPIRQFAGYTIRKARGRSADDEETDVKYAGRSLTRWLDIAAALASVVVIILVAVVISSLKTILDFIGAFASAYISYVVPPLWVIQLRRKGKAFTWMNAEVLFCLALFGLGSFFFVFGTYSAVLDAAGR
uniref:Amino acid transporter transmembrane domain-containing protein n=1 Tax=Zooxanthella nutricula TaxID=1333877 RepID=A0A7S2LYR7_9DINO